MANVVTWTAADGATVIDLTDVDAGYSILGDGTRGLRSVTYSMATAKFAGIDGETVQAVRAEANTPTLGLLILADGLDEFRARTRSLIHAMRPKAGVGVLSVTNEVAETRSLGCYCIGGLEGDEASDVSLPGSWWKVALKLYAPDPWWEGDPQTLTAGLGAPTTFFPIFPLDLSPSTVQGNFSVDLSDADAESYPVWTITGPGTALVLSNNTTGRTIEITTTLAGGDTMVIDTRPGLQSVRRGDGTNLMGSVTSDPALWPLLEDVNDITAALAGATAASSISGVYRLRFAGI